jgi:hypothetical protein
VSATQDGQLDTESNVVPAFNRRNAEDAYMKRQIMGREVVVAVTKTPALDN